MARDRSDSDVPTAEAPWYAVIEVTTIRHRRPTISDEYCSSENQCDGCNDPLPDPVSSDSDDSSDSGESNCSHDFTIDGTGADPCPNIGNVPPRWFMQMICTNSQNVLAQDPTNAVASLVVSALCPCLADSALVTDQQVLDCAIANEPSMLSLVTTWRQFQLNHAGYVTAQCLGIDTGPANSLPDIKLQWARGRWKNARVVRRRCFVLTASEVCSLCDF